jgi:exopolyphosphatase / guanosine-5'-triphosphate,3'-diphosphate pyrophosphatase
MRTAVIDLGTNTFNILIADVTEKDFTVIHTEKEGVSLGMGGIHKKTISEDAFQRGLKTLRHFNFICIHYQVERINAFGTSALRDADNASDFVEQIYNELGIKINIISGEKEAQLIYQGVNWSYDFKSPAVIMDIGGGSTEFIFADENGVNEMVSLNIGISRIYQELELSLSDPAKDDEVLKIEKWLEEKSYHFFEGISQDILIGASGTFETFYELIFNKTFPLTKECYDLPLDLMLKKLDDIIFSTSEKRNQNEFLIPIRKKLAPIAAIKTRWVLKKLNVKKVLVSPCSLKEGAMLEGELV